MVKRLAAVYDDRIVLAADDQGTILAHGNGLIGLKHAAPA